MISAYLRLLHLFTIYIYIKYINIAKVKLNINTSACEHALWCEYMDNLTFPIYLRYIETMEVAQRYLFLCVVLEHLIMTAKTVRQTVLT